MIESCTVSIKKIIKTGPICAEIIYKKNKSNIYLCPSVCAANN